LVKPELSRSGVVSVRMPGLYANWSQRVASEVQLAVPEVLWATS